MAALGAAWAVLERVGASLKRLKGVYGGVKECRRGFRLRQNDFQMPLRCVLDPLWGRFGSGWGCFGASLGLA